MTTNGKRTLPAWLSLKCYEKLVCNPASLFSQCVASIINSDKGDGYNKLEEVQHLNFPPRRLSEPIQIVYQGNCTILGCWDGQVLPNSLHHHIERLGHQKFWNTNCRRSRTCIVAALPYHQETTVLNEIHECKRARRILETKQYSCKRRLFE